jgi:hypothetical protein
VKEHAAFIKNSSSLSLRCSFRARTIAARRSSACRQGPAGRVVRLGRYALPDVSTLGRTARLYHVDHRYPVGEEAGSNPRHCGSLERMPSGTSRRSAASIAWSESHPSTPQTAAHLLCGRGCGAGTSESAPIEINPPRLN